MRKIVCRFSSLLVINFIALGVIFWNSLPAADPPATSAVQVNVDAAAIDYANFSRVTGTAEEVIIDFGLNDQPFGPPKKPIPIKQRIVLNMYTAKRLTSAMQLTIERHEGAFGLIEIDPEKRLKPKK